MLRSRHDIVAVLLRNCHRLVVLTTYEPSMQTRTRGDSTIYFFDLHQNVYSAVACKKPPTKLLQANIQSPTTIKMLINQIFAKLLFYRFALDDIFTNIILKTIVSKKNLCSVLKNMQARKSCCKKKTFTRINRWIPFANTIIAKAIGTLTQNKSSNL